MLLSCQVFGRRAGRHAAEVAKLRRGQNRPASRPALAHIEASRGEIDVREVKRRIRALMSKHVLVTRSDRGLAIARASLDEVRLSVLGGQFRVDTPAHAVELNEAWNLLDVGEAMVAAATLRTETRGSHFRTDHPDTRAEWNGPIQVRLEDNCPVARAVPFEKTVTGSRGR
jgi:L-aspartate oxidase